MFLIAQNRIGDVRDRIQKIRRVFQASPRRLCLPRAKYLAVRLQSVLLVTEAQKAAILAIVSSTVGPVLWITGVTWIALSALLGTALSLWAYIGGYYGPGLVGISAMISMMLSIYPAFVLSRQLLLRRLRPILATLPPTSERITSLEERQAIQAVPPRANFTYSTKNSQGRRSRSDGSGSWCDDLASDRYVRADPVGITHAVPGQHQPFRDTQHCDDCCIRICIRDLWTQLESGMTCRTTVRFGAG